LMAAPERELNAVKKDWRGVDLKVALCYPNVYRAGMSGLTVQLLYALLNSRDDVLCERAFLRSERAPILSLESRQPLRRFDVVAFTLQYEEDYVNAVRMLIDSGIPPRADSRADRDPLVIAGGPCPTGNPAPIMDFFDFLLIGEAEPVLDKIVDALKTLLGRRDIPALSDLPGVYVPAAEDREVSRSFVQDLNFSPHPVRQIMPLTGDNRLLPIFGRAVVVEAVRGCNRGCRFCLIGHTCRPMRERSTEHLAQIIENGIKGCDARKVALIGAGLSDHSELEEICEYTVAQGLELSIPSLRVEAVSERLMRSIAKGGQRSLALAPEAGSERLRGLVHKNMDESSILDAARLALKSGIEQLKLYFLLGLPTEKPDDIDSIINLSKKIAGLGFGRRAVRLSVNPFVPKAQTPFQWSPFADLGYLKDSFDRIRRSLFKDPRFEVEGTDPRHAEVQALLSTGGPDIGRAIEFVARSGGGLSAWKTGLKSIGLDMSRVHVAKDLDADLPWNRVDVGLNNRLLISEYSKALEE